MLFITATFGARWWRIETIVLIFAPATYSNLVNGHAGFLVAALFIGGVRLMDRWPALAGFLFRLLCFKPQLGVLIPVMLVATRNWVATASAAVTRVALVGASFASWGWDPWSSLLGFNSRLLVDMIERTQDPLTLMIASPFVALRVIGIGSGVGFVAQTLFALVAAGGVYWVFRRAGDANPRMAIVLTGTIMATPYALHYDFTLLSVAVLCLVRHAADTGFLPGERIVVSAVWLLSLYLTVMNWYGWPLAPVFIGALFGCLMIRARGDLAPAPAGRQTRVND